MSRVNLIDLSRFIRTLVLPDCLTITCLSALYGKHLKIENVSHSTKVKKQTNKNF